MTRETKVGIVVSCSFLGLLGVVVTSKLRGERPPDKEETPAQTAARADQPRRTPPGKPAPAANGWLSNLLSKAQKTEALALLTSGETAPPPPVAPNPAEEGQGDQTGKPALEVSPPALASPAQVQPEKPTPTPPGPGEGDSAARPIPPGKPAEVEAASPGGQEVVPISGSPAEDSLKRHGRLGAFFSTAPVLAEPTMAETLTKKRQDVVGEAPAVAPPASGPPAEVKAEESKPAPVEVPVPGAVEPTDEGKKAVVPLPGAPAEATPSAPKPPSAPEGLTSTPGGEAPLATPAEKKEGDKPQEGLPEVPVLRPVRTAPVGGGAEESSPAAAPDRRLAPAAVLAPSRTTTPSKPKVEVFSVEEYAVQAGDTFATISTKKYHSEKYAEALRLFNANDALLSDAGRDAAINLQPGQTISIPDLTILEKRYSHAIQGLPAGGAVVPEGTSRKAAFKVRPVVGVRAVPGAAPTYEIHQEGVTMREVAAQTLGNGDRWNEILRLNKEYNPERAVPVGVVLKLPADARVAAPVPAVP
jgi:hypothetical protein